MRSFALRATAPFHSTSSTAISPPARSSFKQDS
jgi:hypothetical protein